MGECYLHTVEVTGSNPVSPSIFNLKLALPYPSVYYLPMSRQHPGNDDKSNNEEQSLNLEESHNKMLMKITEDLTGVGGWEKDLEEGVFRLSPGCLHIYGLSSSIVPIEELDSLVHPEELERIKKAFNDAVSGNGFYNIEHRIIRAYDKAERIIRTQGIIIRDKERRPIKMIGALQDITEQKADHKKISRFRQLLDKTNDAIVIHSLDGEKIIDVNHTACKIIGYSREELLKKSIFDLDLKSDVSEIQHDIETTGFSRFETEHLAADGSIVYSEVSLSYLQIEEDSFLVGIVRDISERKKLEKEREERRKYLEIILQAVPDAVIALDITHKVTEWNPGAENLFHYTKEETVGKSIDSLIAFKSTEVLNEARRYSLQVTSGIPTFLKEMVRYTKEGTAIDVLMSAAPITIDGKIEGAVGVYVDISKLKKAEQNITKLLNEKDQLIKEVHHRIKNHMNTMYSILSVQASYFSNKEVLEAFEEAKNRIRLMQSIYFKLYSKDDSHSIELAPFIDELVGDLHRAYHTFGNIRIDSSIEDISVSAKDSLPIGIIVTELVTNSLKYAFSDSGTSGQERPQVGFENGKISVSAKTIEPETLLLKVEDNGVGVPKKIVHSNNYGFGLTLVEGYARQFDGSLSITSGPGTHIEVRLSLKTIRENP